MFNTLGVLYQLTYTMKTSYGSSTKTFGLFRTAYSYSPPTNMTLNNEAISSSSNILSFVEDSADQLRFITALCNKLNRLPRGGGYLQEGIIIK